MRKRKSVEYGYYMLVEDNLQFGPNYVSIREWQPDPAGRGDYDTICTISFEALCTLVELYKTQVPYQPDPAIALCEDAG